MTFDEEVSLWSSIQADITGRPPAMNVLRIMHPRGAVESDNDLVRRGPGNEISGLPGAEITCQMATGHTSAMLCKRITPNEQLLHLVHGCRKATIRGDIHVCRNLDRLPLQTRNRRQMSYFPYSRRLLLLDLSPARADGP
jgi:hypothetical protein